MNRASMTKEYWKALKELNDDQIIIKPSDKGGNIVVMNLGDYIKEAMRQIGDQEDYKLLDTDPRDEHAKIYHQKIREWHERCLLDDQDTILERYHFGMREQKPGESIEEYLTALRKLAATCKFGMTMEERIRDQFMLKCSSDKVRQELWSKDDPSLQEVVTIAKSIEHTLACVEELERSKHPAINKISQKSELQEDHRDCDGGKDETKLSQVQKSKFKDTKCFRCGNLGHYASYKKCPAVNAICKLCNKRGHFA
ncbi:hypothetical protein NDU88_003518 [Pleurodeles waltl]|uniref:Uncharacterized protein n=1 Tax=Pleurodeles waltl TaxID=8319 RepID=A0AAV7TQ06_PLEWA|nr:hypothetical protein NDU88_003518 [Pleurodeles waltl]